MIKLVSDTIDKSDIDALCEWLQQDETPRLTKGELTLQLEAEWARQVGTKHAVFVNSGSSAILLTMAALKADGVGPKIVVPALSWGTDLSSCMLMDYDIHLCDCNLEDLSVDLMHLEHIFQTDKPQILLLVPVLGLVPQMDKIIKLCEDHGVILLEDCCESMGSRYNGTHLGGFGFASMFSMFFGHHISTIEGGFINTNNTDFYHKLLMMRSHGWNRELPLEKQKILREAYAIDPFNDMYTFYMPGMNLRSTDLQAFIGLRSIKKLSAFTDLREYNYRIMFAGLDGLNILELDMRPWDVTSNFAFPVVSTDRDEILKRLKGKVETRPLIAGNLAEHPLWTIYGNQYGPAHTKLKDLPNASLVHKHGFYLPNHQHLSKEDLATMINLCYG